MVHNDDYDKQLEILYSEKPELYDPSNKDKYSNLSSYIDSFSSLDFDSPSYKRNKPNIMSNRPNKYIRLFFLFIFVFSIKYNSNTK